MMEFIHFMLSSTDHTADLKKLQDVLESTGIKADIVSKEYGNQTYSILNISYDDEIVRIKKKRNAGRPFKWHTGIYTCGQIREMQKIMTNKEIAKQLKLSERSLYRRLKENRLSPDNKEFL